MPSHQSAEAPDEALEEAARLAREQAPSLCSGCDWNHGLWPTLRLLGLVTEPALHGEFLRPALAAVPGAAPRVLLSGAADHALLAQVLAAYAGRSPRITVLDICETPLALSRWYAEREGFELATRASDILTFEDADGFDAIVTHSFLGNFAAEVRPALMRQWYSLLKPGGRLLTINRLRGAEAPKTTIFTTEESAHFVQRLTADLEAQRDHFDAPAEALAAMAETYLRNRRSHPVRTREELAAYFEDAGFTLDGFAELQQPDPGGTRPSGPTLPGGGRYMTVIARR